jgi:hypothetical protein
MVVLVFSFTVHAQQVPPCPPTLCLEGENCPQEQCNSNASIGFPELGAVPFEYDWPAPPAITSEVTVSTVAELEASLQVEGRRTILAPGNYGSVSIRGSDKEVVLTEGVTIDVMNISGTRLIIRANPARSGTVNYFGFGGGNGSADVLIDGLFTDSTALTDERNLVSGNRIAIINSRLRAKDFVLGSFPFNTNGPTNFIVANCELIAYGSTQAGVRIQSARNLILVDNRIVKTGSNHQVLRLHTSPEGQKSDNLFVARNQFEGPDFQIRPVSGGTAAPNDTPGMGSVWIESNTWYYTGPLGIIIGREENRDFPERFHLRNNNMFAGTGFWPSESAYSWTAVIEGNTVQPYISPPAWRFR